MTELALGTAQFGLAYGITNKDGQITEIAAKQLLNCAQTAGINFLDTAQAYGNAELVLGRTMPNKNTFKIISKLPSQTGKHFGEESKKQWQRALETSLERLSVSSLDALLLHNAGDLARADKQPLLDWLLDIQDKGLVQRLGVSIYEERDLEGVPLNLLQLVQLPCSLYDQRFIQHGTVRSLIDQGIAVHARSIYLQGLLVTASSQWPETMNPSFRNHHRALEAFANEKCKSLVEMAVGWIRALDLFEAAVIGITCMKELQVLTDAWQATPPWLQVDTTGWAWEQAKDLDPRQWTC